MELQDSPFDSQHYQLRIGRLVPDASGDASALARAIVEARGRGYDVLFVRIPHGHPLRAPLEAAGYPSIDTLVTSTLGRDRPVLARSTTVSIEHHARLEAAADIAAVAAITAQSIQTSHLHADGRLPIAQTRALYAAWARNDVTGRAQRTIVARRGDEVIGYITVLAGPGTAMIDLVAVAAASQGQGIGSTMLASFIDWIGTRDLVATVGTQAENPALALYARCGFVPSETHFTYHLWLAS
jgi:GNAT superfamily N-acetyltransferase